MSFDSCRAFCLPNAIDARSSRCRSTSGAGELLANSAVICRDRSARQVSEISRHAHLVSFADRCRDDAIGREPPAHAITCTHALPPTRPTLSRTHGTHTITAPLASTSRHEHQVALLERELARTRCLYVGDR
jgi:hypothetical protein